MFEPRREAHGLAAVLAALSPLMVGAPAFGQTADAASKAKPPTKRAAAHAPSPNAMTNLVNLLVEQGVLKHAQGQALIKQAESEAFVSRQSAKDASAKADEAAKNASAAAAATAPGGARHVTYVPEIVKRQLREDIKKEVMAKAEKENWASPGIFPEWATRIKFYGDTRVRYEGYYYPSGNDQAGAANFNAVNTGLPYDITSPYFGPTYNVTEDRNRFRVRTRLGMLADLTNGFEAGVRIATGQDNGPVSFNTTLGAGPGNFGKYALWLDRAYLKYQWSDGQNTVSAAGGRFDPPFWSPTELVWWRDMAVDGFAVKASTEIENFSPFVVGGALPIWNTDLNAGINLADPFTGQPNKFASQDRWVFGGQVGTGYKITPETDARLALAYYDFNNVQGRLSSPCFVQNVNDVCDTDLLRPQFAQKGNSYGYLRNILAGPWNNFGTRDQFQYFGLASAFRPLVASGELDFRHFHPVDVTLDGEFVVNTAFDWNRMNANAINNRAGTATGTLGAFDGGNIGWFARLTIGEKDFMHPWGWSVNAGYRYVQSDAVIDAFSDPYFGTGGTNLKGYTIGANLGISKNVWTSVRWMSANNIAGNPFASDTFQLDLQARY